MNLINQTQKLTNDALQLEVKLLQDRLNKIHQILNSFGAPLGSSQYFEILELSLLE